MLSKNRIEKELAELGVALPKIYYYESTDSTNTRAKEYARENPLNRQTAVFIANGQTAGRGRLGRSFVSRAGEGIYISILTYPDASGADATLQTARAAVYLCRAIERLCRCNVEIKWVNDLYLGGKKLAGILTEGEMDEDGNVAYQVVGMGINIYKNAISDEISDIATSIEQECGIAPDRSKLVAEIIREFSVSPSCVYEEYRARSLVIGKRVRVIKLGEAYEGEVLDIEPDFSLLIKRGDSIERLFTGEVSLRAMTEM